MANFLDYLDPKVSLKKRLNSVFTELKISKRQKEKITVFLNLLKIKDKSTYEHLIRVGLLAKSIGEFIQLDPKALFYAGLLHDVGKAQTKRETLAKTEGWNNEDTVEMMKHVIDGYRLIRDCFDFSAEVILWHHKFQSKGYPEEIPPLLHDYSEKAKVMIPIYGRILSLADMFDALHRSNNRYSNSQLDGNQIKVKMITLNNDQRALVEKLYAAGIFTTHIETGDLMENQSDKTIETYRQNFDKYVDRTPSKIDNESKQWMDSFLSHIPPSGVILEIGSASGRDARYFSERGYRVVCTDVIPQALQKLSKEGFETAEFDFRDKPKPEWNKKFNGFFANAVLLHATPDTFENALKSITVVLRDDGFAAFSLKTGEGEEITLEKMDAPRYFRYYSEAGIKEILSKFPFEIINIHYAGDNKWLHIIMKLKK